MPGELEGLYRADMLIEADAHVIAARQLPYRLFRRRDASPLYDMHRKRHICVTFHGAAKIITAA